MIGINGNMYSGTVPKYGNMMSSPCMLSTWELSFVWYVLLLHVIRWQSPCSVMFGQNRQYYIYKLHIQFFFTISLFIKPQISLILDLYTNSTPTDVLWCAQSHVLDCFLEGYRKKIGGLRPDPLSPRPPGMDERSHIIV